MFNSSLISLINASFLVSCFSIFPPGNSHKFINSPYPLLVAKTLLFFLIIAATTYNSFMFKTLHLEFSIYY